VQLVIRRSQADVKGAFGGHKGVSFNLFYRLVLTPEETAVVQRYKLDAHVLSKSGNALPETVGAAVRGVSQTVQSVEVLLNNEDVAKRACDSFYKLLLVVQSFGGEEVVDFPLGSQQAEQHSARRQDGPEGGGRQEG
jgi:predicted YcjX-like family ATPase